MNGVSKLFLRIRIKRLEWALSSSSALATRLITRGEHERALMYIRRTADLARDLRAANRELARLGGE